MHYKIKQIWLGKDFFFLDYYSTLIKMPTNLKKKWRQSHDLGFESVLLYVKLVAIICVF